MPGARSAEVDDMDEGREAATMAGMTATLRYTVMLEFRVIPSLP